MPNRLFFTLKEKQIKQEKLADYLGVAPATVSRWCSNQVQPTQDLLYKMASFFKVGINDLLYCQAKEVKLAPGKEVNLTTLGCNDVYFGAVYGKTKLSNIQSAIIKFTTKVGDTTYSSPLLLHSSPYQNPDIPVIVVNRLVHNCGSTKLTLENCKEEITIGFARPNFASKWTSEVPKNKVLI